MDKKLIVNLVLLLTHVLKENLENSILEGVIHNRQVYYKPIMGLKAIVLYVLQLYLSDEPQVGQNLSQVALINHT